MKNNSYKNTQLKYRFWSAIFLVVFLLFFGFSGYYYYFDYSLIDALYMTIITIGTVGFSEVVPLEADGKIFTALLIFLSIFIFAYSVTTVSAFLISVYSGHNFKIKKMNEKINQLHNHIIICGYGRNGKQAALKLNAYKKDFVVIEQNDEIIEQLLEENILFVDGNATEDETLLETKIKDASFLITSLPSDADNVFITLTARQLNPNIIIFSRASDESSVRKLKIAGANNVIMPDKIGGDHMASLIVAPDLIEFLDNLSSDNEGNMNVQEIMLSQQPDVETIEELNIRQLTGCTVIGYKTPDGNYVVNPGTDYKVHTDGRIIVLGNNFQIQKLNKVFHIS